MPQVKAREASRRNTEIAKRCVTSPGRQWTGKRVPAAHCQDVVTSETGGFTRVPNKLCGLSLRLQGRHKQPDVPLRPSLPLCPVHKFVGAPFSSGVAEAWRMASSRFCRFDFLRNLWGWGRNNRNQSGFAIPSFEPCVVCARPVVLCRPLFFDFAWLSICFRVERWTASPNQCSLVRDTSPGNQRTDRYFDNKRGRVSPNLDF